MSTQAHILIYGLVWGALGACGSDGGKEGVTNDATGESDVLNDTTQPTDTATTDSADTKADTRDVATDTGRDSGGQETVTSGCDRNGFDTVRTLQYPYGIPFLRGYSTLGPAPYDAWLLAIFDAPQSPKPWSGPGSYELGATPQEQDINQCTTCFVSWAGCESGKCDGFFFSQTGGIEVEAYDDEARTFRGKLVDVESIELFRNEETGLIYPKQGGDTWCIDELAIDHKQECDDDSDCTSEGARSCNADLGWCLPCVNDADCLDASAPTCRVAGGYASSCGTIATCDDDDAYEDNDGPSQAKAWDLTKPLEASVCFRGDYNDWFSFTVDGTEPANVEVAVTWPDDPQEFADELTMSIWNSAGAQVDDIAQRAAEGSDLVVSATARRLPPGQYFVNIRFLYSPRFFEEKVAPRVAYTLTATKSAVCQTHADCGDGAFCIDSVCYAAACDHSGFAPAAEFLYADFTNYQFAYAARDAVGGIFNAAALEFRAFEGKPAPIEAGPGTFPLAATAAETTYETCQTCFTVGEGCSDYYCPKNYMAVGGTATVTEFDTNNDRIIGEITGATLFEVRIDPGNKNKTTVIRNPETWCIDKLPFDTAPECSEGSACSGGQKCLIDPPPIDTCSASFYSCLVGEPLALCVDCLEDADCNGDPNGRFCSPAAFTCTECGTDFNCPAATPVCGADFTCGTVDGCFADDEREPRNDGPSGAEQVTLGTEYHRKICGEATTVGPPEADWYLVAVDQPTPVRISVAWSADEEEEGRNVPPRNVRANVIGSDGTVRAARVTNRSPIILDTGLLAGRSYIQVTAENVVKNRPIEYELKVVPR